MNLNINLDDIQNRDNRFAGLIAASLKSSAAFWSDQWSYTHLISEDAPIAAPGVDFFFDDAVSAHEAIPNPAKETIIKQINNIPEDADFYEQGEVAPNPETRNDARNVILGVYPSGLLAGADVYGYYGEINISWQTKSKKVKLIVPPHASGSPLAVYHGQMKLGTVVESKIEPNATAAVVKKWLQWLQG